ncbi:hypothetical protein [Actinocrispum sp. NPDC049592]|uniref:hypothetical protein n=1 Tax=Actinocrispum sp. NPDC049592 TaxID=3154835 RepID=UPI003416D0F9
MTHDVHDHHIVFAVQADRLLDIWRYFCRPETALGTLAGSVYPVSETFEHGGEPVDLRPERQWSQVFVAKVKIIFRTEGGSIRTECGDVDDHRRLPRHDASLDGSLLPYCPATEPAEVSTERVQPLLGLTTYSHFRTNHSADM